MIEKIMKLYIIIKLILKQEKFIEIAEENNKKIDKIIKILKEKQKILELRKNKD